MHEGMIAPNVDATKFYYPNQEPPAAFLASFRRSVWKPSVSFFQAWLIRVWKSLVDIPILSYSPDTPY
jgi:hypothetical protein